MWSLSNVFFPSIVLREFKTHCRPPSVLLMHHRCDLSSTNALPQCVVINGKSPSLIPIFQQMHMIYHTCYKFTSHQFPPSIFVRFKIQEITKIHLGPVVLIQSSVHVVFVCLPSTVFIFSHSTHITQVWCWQSKLMICNLQRPPLWILEYWILTPLAY